jgi:hypothetical protein
MNKTRFLIFPQFLTGHVFSQSNQLKFALAHKGGEPDQRDLPVSNEDFFSNSKSKKWHFALHHFNLRFANKTFLP